MLPFEAEPARVRILRRYVRDQLTQWGFPALADEVQLAVTELATNVIKHVGDGAVATLVMEPREGSLRVEIHDQSHAVPGAVEQECGAERGRGLHLLAGMSADWGTIVTATGKTVWCEFVLGDSGQCLRIQRAAAALEGYQVAGESPGRLSVGRLPVLETSATELIADLLHWLTARGGDPDAILERAQMHFEAEAV
ncbi:ATP-binding protein [Streptomyces sp. NBC_01142]|uniref:ATP-binding protein n=1 Tax=Streptomyces sp. NBC_01142 TaxID=2975865 RepID=UPI002B1D0B80|nr:ATP-binding protein [Streptomyces sp. NBC_01142]